jgi:hypothetical protein
MATAKTTTSEAFTWPQPSKRLLADYLKERVSADANAPHEGLPFITEKGILRVRPSDWIAWLTGQEIDAPKRDALQALKDQGLVQKVYALPTLDGYEAGKSFGLYAGPAPAGTAKPPRRVTARKAAAVK